VGIHFTFMRTTFFTVYQDFSERHANAMQFSVYQVYPRHVSTPFKLLLANLDTLLGEKQTSIIKCHEPTS
jgi:hypothetical protein